MSDMVAEYRLHEFTVDQYHRMAEVGIIESDDRVELLDGYIVEMAPIGLAHWTRHAEIVRYLIQTLGEHAKVIGQGSFPLGLRSEPQPDIAILAPRDYALDGTGPLPHEILAIIELADSSLAKDLGPKRALYARHSIADYLVVDLESDRLLHHADPHELGYSLVTTLKRGDAFFLTELFDIRLEVNPFLRPKG